MTAVIAEDRGAVVGEMTLDMTPAPDLWAELSATIDRAGGDPNRLWVDDSKAILRGGKGRDRLEATCLALLEAVGCAQTRNCAGLLAAVGAGTLESTELGRWIDCSESGATWPRARHHVHESTRLARQSLEPTGCSWRIIAVRSVVIGPRRFNELLAGAGSKAKVHFAAFRELVHLAWELAGDGMPTHLESDKHGGRHYYLEPLIEAFPDTWIDRGVEGPELSRYSLRAPGRRMMVSLSPRADGANGLVALASIVSKMVREVWMDCFNAHWARRIEGLRPTAGYPVDAARFRREIEALAESEGLEPDSWWRKK
jgi:hypothetical protein